MSKNGERSVKDTAFVRTAALIAAAFVLPILAGAYLFAATPSITPEEAARLLGDPKENAVLIDVRSEVEFAAFSLLAAKSLPLSMALADRSLVESVTGGKKEILLICDTGLGGIWAAFRLRNKGYAGVVSVRGGMDAWLSSGAASMNKAVRTLQGEARGVAPFAASLFEQVLIILSAFVLKPLYQVLCLVIIVLLWKRREGDLVAVKWATLSFLLGENACALNYLVFGERSLLMELLHMYGMILCFGLVVYALMEVFDKRVLHFSEREVKCALLPLCGRCYKYSGANCTLRSLFLLILPAAMAAAAIPLSASVGSRFSETTIFGSPVIFGHPVMYQFLEARIYPVLSLGFFGASLAFLLRFREKGFTAAKRSFAMGMALLGFSIMRFLFYWGYQDKPLWADAWEEITEALFIAVLLWVALRVKAAGDEQCA